MSAKALLATVYYLGKCFGFIPFKLCFRNPQSVAELTTFTTGYTIIVPFVCNVIFVWSLLKFVIIDPTVSDTSNKTKNLILMLETLTCYSRNFIIYISIICHRKLFMETTNYAGRVILMLGLKFTNFLDQHCKRMVFVQIFGTTMQMVIGSLLSYDYAAIQNHEYNILDMVKIHI